MQRRPLGGEADLHAFTNFRPFELVPPTTKEEFQEWVCTQVADHEYAEKMMNQALFGTDEAGTSGKLSWACTIYRKTGALWRTANGG